MSEWNGSANPSLDARIEGSDLFDAVVGESTHYINFDFACDFNGVEFYAWLSNPGDNITLWTEYDAGPYGYVFYKKFGKNFNVYPNNVTRVILFPTKPVQGVRLAIKYINNGTETVKFSLNKFQFADMEEVKPSLLQSGSDW